MGGAVSRTADRATSRSDVADAPWMYFCLAMWMDPAEDERNTAWARGFADGDARRSGSARRVPNFIEPDEGAARLRASYGEDKYARLVAAQAASGTRTTCSGSTRTSNRHRTTPTPERPAAVTHRS